MIKGVICATLICCVLAGTSSALSMKQVADKWKGVGGSKSKCSVAVAVAWAESRGNPRARGQNSDSYDRGLWQINSKWHPDVSDSCAYDAKCNAAQAKRISSNGNNWSPWATYKHGRHKQYLRDAAKACGGGWFSDEADNDVGDYKVGIKFSTTWDAAPERRPIRACRIYSMPRCRPGYKVFSVPNLIQPECGSKPTGCLPETQPPANRCRPFYKNIQCPLGSEKKFILNSAQPGCDKIPVCYVSERVPHTRASMLKDYANRFGQLNEDAMEDEERSFQPIDRPFNFPYGARRL